MSATPIFYGRMQNGTIRFDDLLAWGRHCQSLGKGTYVEVTLRKRRTQRSLNQNRYYYGVVVAAVSEATGYTKDEAHEALAFELLAIDDPDCKLRRRRSTADLTPAEFTRYISDCKDFAARELGCVIPDEATVDVDWPEAEAVAR